MEEQDWTLHDLVRSVGLNRTYVGYRYVIFSLKLIREDPERLELVTKRIYPDVARRFDVRPSSVDGALRTAARVFWQRGPWELTGRTREDEPVPSVGAFLERLAWLDRMGRRKRTAAPPEKDPPGGRPER